jgi:hypothetical protein
VWSTWLNNQGLSWAPVNEIAFDPEYLADVARANDATSTWRVLVTHGNRPHFRAQGKAFRFDLRVEIIAACGADDPTALIDVGKPPKLMRMDGLKFLLVPSKNQILYLFHSDLGLELIHVKKLFKKQKQLCVKYTRVLSTAQAERQCKSDANHSVINGSGVSTQTSLGALALQKILANQKKHKDERTIFHRGDFPFETSVENLVGFVPWESACDSVVTKEIDTEDTKSVLANLNAKLSLDRKLTSMSEVDLVYLGSDFSEVDGK